MDGIDQNALQTLCSKNFTFEQKSNTSERFFRIFNQTLLQETQYFKMNESTLYGSNCTRIG